VFSVNKSKPRTKARLEDFEARGVPFAPLTMPTEWAIQSFDEYKNFWRKHDPRDAENEFKPEDLREP
jgi:sulfite oxidase